MLQILLQKLKNNEMIKAHAFKLGVGVVFLLELFFVFGLMCTVSVPFSAEPVSIRDLFSAISTVSLDDILADDTALRLLPFLAISFVNWILYLLLYQNKYLRRFMLFLMIISPILFYSNAISALSLMLFFAISFVNWILYLLLYKNKYLRRFMLFLTIISPILIFSRVSQIAHFPLFLLLGFTWSITALFGYADGEFYEEGWLCMGVMSLWQIFGLLVLVHDIFLANTKPSPKQP